MQAIPIKARQHGFIINTELMLFVTLMVMGLLVGWISLRDSFNAELIDTANAIESSINFHYFNDPNRGLGDPFEENTLEFFQAGAEEGLGLANKGASTPNGSVVGESPPSATGTVTPEQ